MRNGSGAAAAPRSPDAHGLSSLIEELTQESLTYATPAIFERRRRMLNVALELIAERGIDGFTVKDVCARADVSPHTLYKAFESKERLVAVAIAAHVRNFHQRVAHAFPPSTLEGVVCRMIYSDRALIRDRGLTAALVAVHYSTTVDESLRLVTREKGKLIYAPWVEALFRQGRLRRGVSPGQLTEDLTSLLFAVCWEWRRGAISDEAFIVEKLKVLLSYACGVTRGAAQAEVSALLTDVLGPQKRLEELRQLALQA